MAVGNKIAGRTLSEAQSNKIVEYIAGGETVKLSPAIIKNYLVKGNGDITDQEITMFLNLCRFQHLNPFLNEVHLIKYGSQPASMVVGKETFTKRAQKNPTYAGLQAGVIVRDPNTQKTESRIGAMVIPGEELLGGWAKVYVKGYEVPVEITVGLAEYIGTKSDGTVNSQWAKKPGTMIRKVALVQALREAFPDDLGGIYDSSEMGLDVDESGFAPINIPEDIPAEESKPTEQAEIIDLAGVF